MAQKRISIAQAAEQYDVSPTTIRRLISRGDLPVCRFGRKLIRIDPADLANLMRPVPTAGDAE